MSESHKLVSMIQLSLYYHYLYPISETCIISTVATYDARYYFDFGLQIPLDALRGLHYLP